MDAAIDAVNSALAGGMDWPSLHKLIKDERRAGNPVAALIHQLDLERNTATLLLSNLLDGEEEGDDDGARLRPPVCAKTTLLSLWCGDVEDVRLRLNRDPLPPYGPVSACPQTRRRLRGRAGRRS